MSTGFGGEIEDIPAESYDQKVSWKHCQQVFLLPSVEVLWEQMKTVTILEKKKRSHFFLFPLPLTYVFLGPFQIQKTAVLDVSGDTTKYHNLSSLRHY